VVSGSVGIAEQIGISGFLIGITVVSIGTTLPELVVSLTASRKGDADIVLGNLIGSNIFNCSFVIGIGVLLAPIGIPFPQLAFNVLFLFLVSGVLFYSIRTREHIGRTIGSILLISYLTYLVLQLF